MDNLNSKNKGIIEKSLEEFLNANSQAYLLRSDNRELIYNHFLDYLKSNQKIISSENLTLNLQVFDIDKGRALIEYLKNNFQELHLVIISFYSINIATQNALLKALEDIPENIKIILIVNLQTRLLDTVLSRLYFLNDIYILGEEFTGLDLKKIAKNFLKTNRVERINLKEIKEILEQKDEYAKENENKERVNREILESFLNEIYILIFKSLEKYVSENNLIEIKNQTEYLEDISQALKYIKLNSSSGKTIFEFLALKLPVLKF